MRHEDLQPRQRLRQGQQGRPVRRPHRRRRHRRRLGAGLGVLRRRPSPSKRPAVQVGDPFAEKVLIECCLELFKGSLVEGIQDLGAAGISCATVRARLQRRRRHARRTRQRAAARPDADARARSSCRESQERMMAVVTPGEHRRLRWPSWTSGTSSTAWLGEVTDTGRLIIDLARREPSSTSTPRTVAARRPGLRPPVRPPGRGRTRCRPTTSPGRQDPAAADAVGAARSRPRAGRLARTCADKPLDHQPVRPLRRRQHGPGVPGRRRRGPRRRGDRPRRSPSPPTPTAATPSSTRTHGAQLALAEAYRNVATVRRRADGRHATA